MTPIDKLLGSIEAGMRLTKATFEITEVPEDDPDYFSGDPECGLCSLEFSPVSRDPGEPPGAFLTAPMSASVSYQVARVLCDGPGYEEQPIVEEGFFPCCPDCRADVEARLMRDRLNSAADAVQMIPFTPKNTEQSAGAVYHSNIIQGTDEWILLRTGILTASEMKLILTESTLKPANNDKTRAHVFEIVAQRITGRTEPGFVSDDMERGSRDEITARRLYSEHYAPVQEMGFVTREFSHNGVTFTLGWSPDGLVGEGGSIEVKSRAQKHQVKTVLGLGGEGCPDEFRLQIQTGLLVSGRRWCDFVSYCGGLHMPVSRCHPDEEIQLKILDAAADFETRVEELRREYMGKVAKNNWVMTEFEPEDTEEMEILL